ncbi:dTMP kinase [Sphingomonas sp.]|uniref:dTMP kinase n=1 Tax=Sphingomonas sp. TaxID=28214 RepID=UPI0035C7B684
MKPLFIVFEGLDGSGTSTQSRMLCEYLRTERGQKVQLTAQPSGGPVGQMIRSALSGRLRFSADEALYDRQLAHLFAADRHDHLWNDTDGVMRLLERGEHVVCTRYFFSSYAYHCRTEDDIAFVRALNADFPDPNAVIFIDVEVDTSAKRLAERASLDRYESEEKLVQVRAAYERSFDLYNGPLLRISGTEAPSAIHARVASFVEGLLR